MLLATSQGRLIYTCLKEIIGDIRCVGKAAVSVEEIEPTVGLVSGKTSPKIHQPPPGVSDNPASEEQGGLGAGAAQRPCGN